MFKPMAGWLPLSLTDSKERYASDWARFVAEGHAGVSAYRNGGQALAVSAPRQKMRR